MKRRCLEQVSLSSAHLLFHRTHLPTPHTKALCAVGFSFQPVRFAFLLPPFWPCLPWFVSEYVCAGLLHIALSLLFTAPVLRTLLLVPCSIQFQHSLARYCMPRFVRLDSVTYLVADRWEAFGGQ